MQHAEIQVASGFPEGEAFSELCREFDGPDAIRVGYRYFMKLIEDRADWLLFGEAKRDFDDNLTAQVTLRIGPLNHSAKQRANDIKV